MSRCDIVLLVWNQLDYTAKCIESIFKHTSKEDRLLIVDNGSEDPTKTYLTKLNQNNPPIEMIVLRNETNEGFAKGMNRGMRYSDAPYVCLMNNDTLASPDWLNLMIAVAEANTQIGLINPALAPKEVDAKGDKWIETSGVNGFCMLIKRSTIKKIGYLDEVYERGFFEDTDYSRRAHEAGYISAIAKGAYVYHYGHKSFETLEEKGEDIFRKNRRIFESRWGKIERIAYIATVDIKKSLQSAIGLARRGAFVQFFFKGDSLITSKESFFDSLGLREHANITICPISGPFFKLQVFLRILKKRKKPFTKIVR